MGGGDTNFFGTLSLMLRDLDKGFKQLDIGERIETIKNTALLKSFSILRTILENCEELL